MDDALGGSAPPVELIPLGGLGEFGMNMMVVACGDTAILVDAGVMFPEPELLGVDLIIPDLRQLTQYHLAALVLTHGHEDHIGAVAHVLPYINGPIYGTALTLAFVEPKLEDLGAEARRRLVVVKPRDRVTVGAFTIEFLRVTHSIPDCVALAIETPRGVVIHTGDFKIDQTPLDGEHVDFHRLAELGSKGVLALLGDSTNIERKGFTGSEIEVVDAFEEIFTSAPGKIIVAMFASSLYRMQILADLAAQFEKHLAFVGRGVIENSEIAQRLGYLRMPAGVQIRDSEIRNYPSQDVVCICTGSQGEPAAALPRIAIDDHRHVKLDSNDVVVFSAREIPGNEKAIGRVMNHIARRKAEVVYEGIKHVHVSGHGSEEELKLMLSLVRPRHFVPIHGEYRQLARHARVAARVSRDTKVLLAENGHVIRFDDAGGRIAGTVPAGRILIDGTRSGEVGDEILRDRRHLAGDGLVVPVVTIGEHSGVLEEPPDVITRGFVLDARTEALLKEVPALLAATLEAASIEERTDPGLIKEKIRVDLQRFFRKRSGLRPLVLPVVMEI
ncbi:MAG: ribonuclease J [Acidobacteria bacterium RIFCSPLOWO2_02_FULL_67_36]|nr:MAG: ribonuclease J [Acidobacteria bacterium RIFCSPLOWO2_02_FULL_67_36]OFW23378.1 MAG: ribonuclease J [Acidobacteria bacterium RIFCSPLOWO2_12_FULL_66_21]